MKQKISLLKATLLLATLYLVFFPCVAEADVTATERNIPFTYGFNLGDHVSKLNLIKLLNDWKPPTNNKETDRSFSVYLDRKSDSEFLVLHYYQDVLISVERFAFYKSNAEAIKAAQIEMDTIKNSFTSIDLKKDNNLAWEQDNVSFEYHYSLREQQRNTAQSRFAVFSKVKKHLADDYIKQHRIFPPLPASLEKTLALGLDKAPSGNYISGYHCLQTLSKKDKDGIPLVLETATFTFAGPDLNYCEVLTDNKIKSSSIKNNSCSYFFDGKPCDQSKGENYQMQKLISGKRLGYTRLIFKDLDGNDTVVQFMHSGSMMSICSVYKKILSIKGIKAKCLDVRSK